MSLMHLDETNFDAVIKEGTTLVDFWAPWCGPCRMVGPMMEDIAVKYEGKAKICKLNVDEAGGIAARYGIMGIPTVIVFKDGKAVNKAVGVKPQSVYESMISV